MNILILTGKFGMGHWSASQSLRQQLLGALPAAQVEIVDFPAYAMPSLSDTMYKCFNLVVTHGTHLFNTYYNLTALGHTDARPLFEHLLLDKLVELLHQHRPDAVVATHPLCAQAVSRLKGDSGLDLPLITCVTDVTSHPEWINRYTDCYLVPSQEVRRALVKKGVPAPLICVTGIPVREEFYSLPRRRTGGGREVLIMGGGLGLLPKDMAFYAALDRIPGVHATVITGRNQRLYQRLRGRFDHVEAVGYTDRVWDYMSRADLIVTKPGGITLFEAIFAQLPLLVWPPQLQQEKNNARWLRQAGIGWVAPSQDCAGEIEAILRDGQALSRAARRMGQLRAQLETESINCLMQAIDQVKEVAA